MTPQLTRDLLTFSSILSLILDALPTAVVVVDRRGVIALVNTQAEQLFGYGRQELLGVSVEILVPQRFRAGHPELRTSYLTNAPVARPMGAGRDLYALRRDGSEFPVEIGLNPIQTEEGQFVVSAIIDITERKRLLARFRATVESAPTAMVMVDPQGSIVLVNAEASRLFGYAPDALLGQKVEVLVPERFVAAHPRWRGEFFTAPRARRMGEGRDLFALRQDGSEFPVEIGLNPIQTEEGMFILAAIVDLTERKLLEAALRQANDELERRVQERTSALTRQTDELERANEALIQSNLDLQRFAYIASHDLQAPLRSITGFVQLIQLEYSGRLDAQADDWIRRTVQSVEQLQALIRDLLAYSRVETQAHPFEPIALREVVADTLKLLEVVVREAGAEVSCDDLPTVMGDHSQLLQLMQNLLGNALKFRAAAAPRIEVRADRNGDEWVVSVRDNGIGIDPKQHERIFEIFHRGHSQHEYPGTGIGLAVCRRVVLRHGGRIWVESAPGAGSVFYVTIPVMQGGTS